MMMAAYNPNDELRAIVQRKQHETKQLLAAHTATDDRLQASANETQTRTKLYACCSFCNRVPTATESRQRHSIDHD